jgi:hypothetical protein
MAIPKRLRALAALAIITTIPTKALAASEAPITAADAAAFMAEALGPTIAEPACHDFENADGWGQFLCFARIGDGTQLVKATMGAPDGVLYLGQPFVAVIDAVTPQLTTRSSLDAVGDVNTPTVEDAVIAFTTLDTANVMFPACDQLSPQTFTCYAVLFDTTTGDNRLISATVAFDSAATSPIAWDNIHTYLTDPSIPAPAAVLTGE